MLKRVHLSLITLIVGSCLGAAYGMESQNSDREDPNQQESNHMDVEVKKKRSHDHIDNSSDHNEEESALKKPKLSIHESDDSKENLFNMGCRYSKEQNDTQAFKCYKLAADQGHVAALFNLGNMYLKGRGVDQNYEEASKCIAEYHFLMGMSYLKGEDGNQNLKLAFRHFTHSAEYKHVKAQYQMGKMFFAGKGVGQNVTKAFEWYKLAANQKYDKAQFKLGDMYLHGMHGKQSFNKAFDYYKLAADQGHDKAQFDLGWMYQTGKGTDENLGEAFRCYMISSRQGNDSAQFKLGDMYFNGWGVGKDLEEAFKYFMLSANQDRVEAQFQLGQMYLKGEGIGMDVKKAFDYFMLAAMQEDADAQNQIGQMYLKGEGIGMDVKKAFDYFMLAAMQEDADAQYQIGQMYLKGEGVDKDLTMAFKYYKLAADQYHPIAQCNVGCMYLKGEGVDKDSRRAFYYYKLSAKQQRAEAQYNLGLLYFDGVGVSKDLSKAFKYYKLAADQEHVEAQFNLGIMCFSGLGLERKDLKEAFNYFSRAAKQNNVEAQFTVGNMYFDGAGVGKNLKMALEHFKLSADQNHVKAQLRAGYMYNYGIGTDKNSSESHKYIGKYVASRLGSSGEGVDAFVKHFTLLITGESEFELNDSQCSNILWALGQLPAREHEKGINRMVGLKNEDANSFNDIVSSPIYCLSYLMKNPIMKASIIAQWFDILKSPDRQSGYGLLDVIEKNHKLLGLSGEDPIVYTVLCLIRDTREGRHHDLDRYRVYYRLKENLNDVVPIDQTLLTESIISAEMGEDKNDEFNVFNLALNPNFLKDFSNKANPLTFKDLPACSRDFLPKMKTQMEGRFKDSSNTLPFDAQEYSDVVKSALGDDYLNDLLLLQGNADDLVPDKVKKLIYVISYLESLDNTYSSTTFSAREDKFLMMLAPIGACQYGKDGGIDDAYARLPKSAQFNDLDFLDAIIRTQLEKMFDGTTDFFKKLTNTSPDDQVEQAIHQAIYVKNLIGREAGVVKADQPLEFDMWTFRNLSLPMVNLLKEEVLMIFYEFFKPSILIDTIVAETNKEMIKPLSTLGTYFFEKFGNEKWFMDGWKENFPEPDTLNKYGAIQFLVKMGIFQKM